MQIFELMSTIFLCILMNILEITKIKKYKKPFRLAKNLSL